MKQFLIIGNMNAVTYNEFFRHIKDGRIWLGENAKGGTRKGNSLCFTTDSGEKKEVPAWWYANMDNSRRNKPLELVCTYSPDKYPKYDNYDAIEVSRSHKIPYDYQGVMAVPISFLMFHCPSQFEIVGSRNDGNNLSVNGKNVYFRILIKKL